MRKRKLLIAFIGPVGSGKTYIARRLSQRLGAVHIRTDDIRVALRKRGKSYSTAGRMAKHRAEGALEKGKSIVLDFDAVRSAKQREYRKFAKRFGARSVFIKVRTPEKIILSRLRRHRYTRRDLFQSAAEAIRVYFMRRKFHQRKLKSKPDFVINNARPLEPQIRRIVKNLKG